MPRYQIPKWNGGSCWPVGNPGITCLQCRSEDFLNSCCTAMKQMAAWRKWIAFTWKESWWAGLPLHGADWQPAQSQTVWECWINTRSEELETSELEFGASDEKNARGREMFIVLASARLCFQESAVSAAWKRTGHLGTRRLSSRYCVSAFSRRASLWCHKYSFSDPHCRFMPLWHSLDAVKQWFFIFFFAFSSCTDLRNLIFSTSLLLTFCFFLDYF